jgi:hypothetical protein
MLIQAVAFGAAVAVVVFVGLSGGTSLESWSEAVLSGRLLPPDLCPNEVCKRAADASEQTDSE